MKAITHWIGYKKIFKLGLKSFFLNQLNLVRIDIAIKKCFIVI